MPHSYSFAASPQGHTLLSRFFRFIEIIAFLRHIALVTF